MPILSSEPNLLPEGLLDDERPAEPDGLAWWVLHAKPRQEKSLARQFLQAGLSFYLPLLARRCKMRGRVMTSHVPLFPGYVFLRADPDGRRDALATRRVVRTLEVADQEAMWGDLRQLHRLITCGLPVTPEDRLAPGMRVEIRSGPLAGMKGQILRSASGRRFVVQVDFIQRGASVMLDDFTLVYDRA